MGRTNLKYNLERKLAQSLGELAAAEKEVEALKKGLRRLIPLRVEVSDLRKVVEAAETLLKHDHPDWTDDHIRPVKAGAWSNPFKTGDQGQIALATLREADGWLRPREVAKLMLAEIGHDPEDSEALQKVSNSIGNYFKKYDGDIVESQGSFYKEWRVIR